MTKPLSMDIRARALAREGRLVLPAPQDPVEFASLMIGPVGDGARCAVGAADRPEIVAGAVAIRLEAGASATHDKMRHLSWVVDVVGKACMTLHENGR